MFILLSYKYSVASVSFFQKASIYLLNSLVSLLKTSYVVPGWGGSVDWGPTCGSKRCQFNSRSGHMPGFQARSPVKKLLHG